MIHTISQRIDECTMRWCGLFEGQHTKKVIRRKAGSYIVIDHELYYTGNKQKQPVKVVSEGEVCSHQSLS